MKTLTWTALGFGLALGFALTLAAAQKTRPLETVPAVDLDKYMGTWYEIAAFPQKFQKGCHCTTAEYARTDKGYVRVVNSCRKDGPSGKLTTAKGKAFVVKNSGNAKLRVQFFWPFRGDYWIIDLAPDYSFAVVGAPDRDYLWILSRAPQMDESLYREIVGRCAAKGFDIKRLVKTDQSCAGR
ncbi:MAG: lipocalin family protein [Candidatus Aminicenantes bacterium]|nr:lipocalin family protein [Candidatus Aminicenantes bacterium]